MPSPASPERLPLSGAPNVAGADYVRALTRRPADLRARAAFRQLALELAPPGARILEFGAGPGLDAHFYAERGREVVAYDVDPKMCDYFASHCAAAIADGTVTLQTGSYETFLTQPAPARAADLVTANFAPFNLIDDPARLFGTLARLTTEAGAVLVSALSPGYLRDLRYAWWWGHLPQLLRHGRFALPGSQAAIWRRTPADFAQQAQPHFEFIRAYRGLTDRHGRADRSGVPGTPRAWRYGLTCRFLFLLFRKPARHTLA